MEDKKLSRQLQWRKEMQMIKDFFYVGSKRIRKFISKLFKLHILETEGILSAKLIRDGQIYDYGTVSRAKVTTEFVNYLVDQLQAESSDFGDFKYHLSGTGTDAEAIGDTELQTPDGTSRAVGTQTEGASDEIYRSVATISYSSSLAITEHGIFNEQYAAAQTDGILLDRSVFSAINVENGDQIEFTYELTVNAET
jgi:hypothetical protein